jgi:DNA-binding response OmpR family regulator
MPRTLLLVEDDHATRMGLEDALTDAGYRVIPVATLRAAVKAFRDERPDAAVVDIRLGAYNGMHLLALNTRGIPIIVMTGFVDAVLERDVQQLGGTYLLKPFPASALVSMLERLLPSTTPLLDPPDGRRWIRRQVQAMRAAQVGGARAILRDVSYGGVGLDVDGHYDIILPAVSDLTVEGAAPIHLRLIWKRKTAERRWLYGGAVTEEDRIKWEEFLETVV